ncbi:MAG: ATP-binding protein [Elusimicrobiota bacterium]|jgi:predicted AAA+ superfamily ATPase|nr:ATP-binding protein [Elusimicrobiota bacterium]
MEYIHRNIERELINWRDDENRKPLLLRGARQVGKSSLARYFGSAFEHFLEINFDDEKPAHQVFERYATPIEICKELEILYKTPIIAGKTLLFLDEIQSCQAALSKLRYFYEKYPQLHLIAAGSLLEFAFEQVPSFAVGRLRSMFLYPFNFEEFLIAQNEKKLVQIFREASPAKPLSEPIHNLLLKHLKKFLLIGGMPEAVSEYVKTDDISRSQQVLDDIIISLKSDFAKYKKRVPAIRINEVFESAANQADGKFVYEKAAINANNMQVKEALELLIMSGIVYPVTHSAANGIPLGAEANYKFRRVIFNDTGIFQRVLGLDTAQLYCADDFKIINRGALAEIFAGVELIKGASCYNPIQLYYWQREKKQSNAQIDYLIQRGETIIPIEVKSGTRGSMQSLHLFMKEKNIKRGARTSLENFAQYENIDVYPLYAVSNLMQSNLKTKD